MTAMPHTLSHRMGEGRPEGIRPRVTALAAAIAVALALTLIACGGGGSAQTHEFDLVVAHGDAVGENTFVVMQGDTATLNVTADIAGVFHVHGYDLRARVEAGGSGVIEFEADATGRFEIALHPADVSHDVSGMEGMESMDGESGGMEGMDDSHDMSAMSGEVDIVVATLEVQPR